MRDRDRRTLNEKKRRLLGADITLKNNTNGKVNLKSDRNGGSIYSMEQYETIDVPFEDLQSIVKKHKKIFEQFTVIIDDVYAPGEEDITVEDVEEVLGLSRIKKGLSDTPDDLMFDDLLLDYSFEEFEDEVETFKPAVIKRLAERAIYLYLQKEFSNGHKMNLLEKKLGVKNIFEDVDKSQKPIRSDIDMM